MRKLILTAAAFLAALIGTVGQVSAHAVSIGYENAGPGAVTVWLGTYQHGGHHLEGSLQLEGVLGTVFGPTTNPFTMLTCDGALACKPAGLVDGTTNFYIPDISGANEPLVGTEAGFNAACPACGPVNHWQGVTFSGLSEGDYQFTYVPIAFPSQEWDILDPAMEGIFHLGQAVINPTAGVPEPVTIALFGAGLTGVVGIRRRKARKAI